MKRAGWLIRSCVVLCCLIVVLPTSGSAQNPPRSGSASIPFDFYIAGNKLPAGAYTLDIIAPTYVLLRSNDGKVQQDLYFMQTAVAGKDITSQIVFAVRDGKYYFAEVWSWFGKAQLTSFNSKPGDQKKDVPLKPTEKTVAKPSSGL
jgi:hypothetical protein